MSWPGGLLVAVGGGLGATIRFALSTVAPDHAGSFPTTILAINLVVPRWAGCHGSWCSPDPTRAGAAGCAWAWAPG